MPLDQLTPTLNRAALQQLADIRIIDARALFVTGHFSGAYYIGGYAIECAIKSTIASLVREFDFPDKRFATAVWTHRLVELMAHSPLVERFKTERNASTALQASWSLCIEWNEDVRYEKETSRQRASDFLDAIDHPTNGVLTWLRKNW